MPDDGHTAECAQSPVWVVAVRAVALFVGGFTLLNIVGQCFRPGFDANYWWIDLRPMPAWPARVLLGPASLLFVTYAVWPRLGRSARRVASVAAAFLCIVALCNAASFYVLLGRGKIGSGFPVPFSLLVALALAGIAAGALRNGAGRMRARELLIGAAVLVACMIGLPVAQMFCFGKTDYARRADAVVVFGARAYADGRLSQALADRVRTACGLYERGLADRLIFSGGPGDGAVHETEAMRRFALRLGVPDEAIVLDAGGVNTGSTVSNTCRMFDALAVRRVMAVSHFYHLPRIKMSYRRMGREVYTVPARETYVLTQMPYFVLREVVALWVYYLRPPRT